MRVIVQKYGGSSVATTDRLQHVARKIISTQQTGAGVVVVVSAMGTTTNDLLSLARSLSTVPDHRELDMLLSSGERISMALLSLAIQACGVEAISLTGPQAGIRTDNRHTNARITRIRPCRIQEELARGRIVIVAGFQGLSGLGEITTLGRGGSDTSAVALAAALGAERCDIYSDVDGVYTADPNIVPSAQPIAAISYDEMHELARQGARVLHADAVECARQSGVEIAALSTFGGNGGTRIGSVERLYGASSPPWPGSGVTGVAGRTDLLQVRFDGPHDTLPHDEALLEALSECEVLSLRRHYRRSGRRQLDLLVLGESIPDVEGFATRLRQEYDGMASVCTGLGSVAAVGLGMGTQPKMHAYVQRAMQQEGLSPIHSFTTPVSVSCLVPASGVHVGLRKLHQCLVETPRGDAVNA